MILLSQLTEIGDIVKPHGINGEMSAVVDGRVDIDDLRCIVLDMDGIFVPFFISSYRTRGSEAVLLTIDGITDDVQAKSLAGKTIYAISDELPDSADNDDEDGFYASDFIGWTVTDDGKRIGEITDFDDTTENVLFVVQTDDDSIVYIPVADEFIEEIDTEARVLSMSLPTGIFDL